MCKSASHRQSVQRWSLYPPPMPCLAECEYGGFNGQAITALGLFQIKIVRLPIEVCLIVIQQKSIYKEMGQDGRGGGGQHWNASLHAADLLITCVRP